MDRRLENQGGLVYSETVPLLTMSNMKPLNESQLQQLLQWIDQAPITRDKKKLAKDMSDAVPVAQIIKYFVPKLVELHSYQQANNVRAKEQNWFLLSRKVLTKLGFELDVNVIHSLATEKPWVIENVLKTLRHHIDMYLYNNPALSRCLPIDDESPGRERIKDSLEELAIQQRRQIHDQKKKIELLTTKMLKLEHMVHLKDIRVKDLITRLEKLGLTTTEDYAQLRQLEAD